MIDSNGNDTGLVQPQQTPSASNPSPAPPQTGGDSSFQLSSQPLNAGQTGQTGAPQSQVPSQAQPQQPPQIPNHPQVDMFKSIYEGLVGGVRLRPVLDASGQP